MANPQIENGFTPIANELLEIICQSNFTPREFKIILTVIRYTNGFRRNAAELSLAFLSNATKIHFRHVQRTVKNLISKNVLAIENDSNRSHSRKIQLNINYESWDIDLDKNSSSREELVLTTSANRTLTNLANPEEDSTLTVPANKALTIPAKSTIDQSSQPRKKKENLNKIYSDCYSLPTELKEVRGFGEIWNDWLKHRKEIKKPLTPTAAVKQFKKLIEFKNKGQDVIEIIETAIEKGWQGFYELKQNNYAGAHYEVKQRITDKLKLISADDEGWM